VKAQQNVNTVPMQEVCVQWSTTGLSQLNVGGTIYNTYRMYVTLDPENNLPSETHEWKDANGQVLPHSNNEGYWPWGTGVIVQPKGTAGTNGSPLNSPLNLSMREQSLGVLTPGGLSFEDGTELVAGNYYKLAAKVHANATHPHYRHVFFYDGDPRSGGRLIGSRILMGVSEGDNYVWIPWRPQTSGSYLLYAHVLQGSDDPAPGDSWDTLTVNVVAAPTPTATPTLTPTPTLIPTPTPNRGGGGGCSIANQAGQDAPASGMEWIALAFGAFFFLRRKAG
jgi:hypothetical protein